MSLSKPNTITDELKELKKEQGNLILELEKLLKLDKAVNWLKLKIKRITKPMRIPHKKIFLTLKSGKKLSGYYILDKVMEDKTNYITVYKLRNRFGLLINGNGCSCINKESIAFYHIEPFKSNKDLEELCTRCTQ